MSSLGKCKEKPGIPFFPQKPVVKDSTIPVFPVFCMKTSRIQSCRNSKIYLLKISWNKNPRSRKLFSNNFSCIHFFSWAVWVSCLEEEVSASLNDGRAHFDGELSLWRKPMDGCSADHILVCLLPKCLRYVDSIIFSG